jgi:hypothetical protein
MWRDYTNIIAVSCIDRDRRRVPVLVFRRPGNGRIGSFGPGFLRDLEATFSSVSRLQTELAETAGLQF